MIRKMPRFHEIEQVRLLEGRPVPRAGGVRTASLRIGNCGVRVPGLKNSPLLVQFEPSSFEGAEAERLSAKLRLEGDPDLERWIRDLERHVVELVVNDAEKYFKRPPPAQEIRDSFNSCIQESDQHPPLLKTKLCLAACDKGGVRCWGPDCQRCDRPERWKGQLLAPNLWFARLYFASSGWGLVVELADAMLLGEVQHEQCCPWDPEIV
jgi:hypothetical protein